MIMCKLDKKGKVIDIIFNRVEKNGRVFVAPQMIDITDKNSQEIYDLIFDYENKMFESL